MFYVKEKVPYYKFGNLARFSDEILHGISLRHGGVSKGPCRSLNLALLEEDGNKNVRENHRRFALTVGYDAKKLAIAYQSHGDKLAVLKKMPDTLGLRNHFSKVDGFITNLQGLPLMVRFADCQGVLIFDPGKKVIAAVHSGWRGNAKNIIGKAVKKMQKEFLCEPADLIVGIGPSLGPCCASFSDPFDELPEFMHKYVSSDKKVNLWECSLDQLKEAGVLPGNIELAGKCTVCENKEFFSFRGGKRKTGHMGGVIEILPQG